MSGCGYLKRPGLSTLAVSFRLLVLETELQVGDHSRRAVHRDTDRRRSGPRPPGDSEPDGPTRIRRRRRETRHGATGTPGPHESLRLAGSGSRAEPRSESPGPARRLGGPGRNLDSDRGGGPALAAARARAAAVLILPLPLIRQAARRRRLAASGEPHRTEPQLRRAGQTFLRGSLFFKDDVTN